MYIEPPWRTTCSASSQITGAFENKISYGYSWRWFFKFLHLICWFKQPWGIHSQFMSFTIVKVCQKKLEVKNLTDVFVLTFSLRFKLYLYIIPLSIFSTSLAMLPIELLSLGNDDTCFKYYRAFLISPLSREILASLTYSKINIC